MTDNPGNTRGTDHPQPRSRPAEEPANASNTTQPTSQFNSQSQSTPSQAQAQAQPTLANRIQTSAAGLARSAFHGGAGDISQTISSLSDGKSGSSATGSFQAGGQGYRSSRETSTGPRGPGPSEHAGQAGAESFREGGTGSTLSQGGFVLPDMSAEEFQRGEAYADAANGAMMSGAAITETVDTSSRSSLDDLQGSTGSWKGKGRAHDPVQLEYNTAWQRAEKVGVQQQQQQPEPVPTDGAAVVSLLSDASFDPNFDPSTDEIDLDPAASPAPLTATEIETLESFKRQMGSSATGMEGSSQQQHQLSGHSLIPDIDTFFQQNDPAFSQTQTTPESATSLRDNVLANLPGAADWIAVQERYHDEVWGYLRPALEAAKAEMEEKGAGGEGHGEDGPAVRRLKMILRHMKA